MQFGMASIAELDEAFHSPRRRRSNDNDDEEDGDEISTTFAATSSSSSITNTTIVDRSVRGKLYKIRLSCFGYKRILVSFTGGSIDTTLGIDSPRDAQFDIVDDNLAYHAELVRFFDKCFGDSVLIVDVK
jgi:hypothetical protein